VKLSLALKNIVLPDETWSLDVDLRYLPVARFVKRHAKHARILDVGSSALGITPYLASSVVGADSSFPDAIADRLLPVVTRYPLPFRDDSFDIVLSLDTFEHVPREHRQAFLTEMMRTARRYVIIGFPEGKAAEDHDAEMEHFFTRQHGSPHAYFLEHREFQVPRGSEFQEYLACAALETGKTVDLKKEKNVNIGLRSFFMRLVWHRNRLLQQLYTVATSMSRWDRLFHFGTCYRSIYYLTLNDRH
jgi:hypothetical protein